MTGKQHLFFGTTTATALCILAHYTKNQTLLEYVTYPALTIASSIFGSLLPDIDTPYSILGKKIPFLSTKIYIKFGHRTYTHDIGLFLILAILSIMKYPLSLGFWIGYIGHLFLDGFTYSGTSCFYLFSKKHIHFLPKFMRVKTNSPLAYPVTLLITACVCFCILYPMKTDIYEYYLVPFGKSIKTLYIYFSYIATGGAQ